MRNTIYNIAEDMPKNLVINGKVYIKTYMCYFTDDLIKSLQADICYNMDFIILKHKEASIYSSVVVIYMTNSTQSIFEIKCPQYSEYKLID
jgi:hypothetical protein